MAVVASAASPRSPSAYAGRLSKREQYDRLFGRLRTERASFINHWQDLALYFKPRRPRFLVTDRNRGDRRNEKIIDSTTTFAIRTLASGLHAGLTSPARPWLRLSTADPELAENDEVKSWLHTVTQRMLSVFVQTNLYNVLPTVYGDMGLFATAAMGVLEDRDDLFRAYSYPIGSFVVSTDDRYMVNTFGREYQMTIGQLVAQFGYDEDRRTIDRSKFSRAALACWDRGDVEETVDVCWLVKPNYDADPTRMRAAERLPFYSCYFEKGASEDQVLRESGFHEFPVMCPRWDVTDNDAYGTDCPGMIALGDAKALQTMEKRKGQAIEKMVHPPHVAPPSLRNQKTSLLAGDITYLAEGQDAKLRPIHEVRLSIQELMMDEDRTRYRIQRACHEDLFLMLATSDQTREGAQPITAREVQERHEEKLLALGPVLERTNDELLDPLVDRTFALMLRNGFLDDVPAPEALGGMELKVEYESLLAQAQKLVGVSAQDRFLSTIVPLFQFYPEMRHKLNPNAIVTVYQDMLGANPKIVRPDEEAEALAGAERAQAQQAASSAQALQGAQAAQALGQTPMDQNTALDRLLEGAGAQASGVPATGMPPASGVAA